MDLIFQKDIDESRSEYKFIYIYYVLKGYANITFLNKDFYLKQYDIIVINPGEEFKIIGKGAIIARFGINVREFLRITNNKQRYIICNTVRDKNDNFEKLRNLLDLLINSMYEKELKELIFRKYSYDLILLLISDFTNNTYFDVNIEKRKLEVENYICANYTADISLENIAINFGLTPQYFSKYFKESFGLTFLKYLNKVRLENACHDLINSNSTILKVALDNGFPNITSFTKSFKEFYGMNAAEYRLNIRKKNSVVNTVTYDEVITYLTQENKNYDENVHSVMVNGESEKIQLKPYWLDICNLGGLSKLLNNGMKEQVSELQKEIGFNYARLELDTVSTRNNEYHFFEEQKALDFIIDQNLKVMLVMDFRRFAEENNFSDYFRKFLYHFINRYGLKNITEWRFEVFYNSDFKDGKSIKYKKFYEDIKSILNDINIRNRIFGPGLVLDQEGGNLRRFIKSNKEMNNITITVAPYSVEEEEGNVFLNRTTDSNYVLNQYLLANQICSEENLTVDIYISSWREALGNFNSIYDSSYRASNILRNVINGYNLLKSLPIDRCLDLMFEEKIDNNILSGMPGILTRKGIKKPAFYAYKFLKKLDRYFVYKDNYVLITNDENKYYQIVCHNCKKLNYKFYSSEVDNIEKFKIDQLFDDTNKKFIKFKFSNLENGRYFLKYRSICESNGSVLSNFERMNFQLQAFFGLDEIDYLKSVSKPFITGEVFNVNNGELSFQCELEQNEIKHLHLIYAH